MWSQSAFPNLSTIWILLTLINFLPVLLLYGREDSLLTSDIIFSPAICLGARITVIKSTVNEKQEEENRKHTYYRTCWACAGLYAEDRPYQARRPPDCTESFISDSHSALEDSSRFLKSYSSYHVMQHESQDKFLSRTLQRGGNILTCTNNPVLTRIRKPWHSNISKVILGVELNPGFCPKAAAMVACLWQ